MSPRRPEKPAPVIVKRSSEERKKLPPELEAFARSQDEKLRLRRPRSDKGRVNDPREGYTIAGVSNRDARAVYDVRAKAMRALWAEGRADEAALAELAQLLHDAKRLVLWRARRITGFDAFVEQVLGIHPERAFQLVESHATRSGLAADELNERTVAAWLRTEAGLYEGDESARVSLREGRDGLVLELSVRLTSASAAFAGAGARHAPLAREAAENAALRPGAKPAQPRVADEEGEPTEVGEPESSAEPAPPAAGGAKLLTRKRAVPASVSEWGDDDAPELEEEERPEIAPAPAATAGRRGGFSPKPRAGGEEREGKVRRFEPQRGFDAGEREPRSFGKGRGFGTKRPFARDAEAPSFGQRPGFGQKRPFGAGRDEGGAGARGFGAKRFERKGGFEEAPERGERPNFGQKRPFKSWGSDRPAFERGAGKRPGAGGDKPFGKRDAGRGDRPFKRDGGGRDKPFAKRDAGRGDKPFAKRGGKPFGKAPAGKGGFTAGKSESRGGFGRRDKPAHKAGKKRDRD